MGNWMVRIRVKIIIKKRKKNRVRLGKWMVSIRVWWVWGSWGNGYVLDFSMGATRQRMCTPCHFLLLDWTEVIDGSLLP